MVTVCGAPGTMEKEVRPAEFQRHQGSLFSVTSDLTVTKHLDKVKSPVCIGLSVPPCTCPYCSEPVFPSAPVCTCLTLRWTYLTGWTGLWIRGHFTTLTVWL